MGCEVQALHANTARGRAARNAPLKPLAIGAEINVGDVGAVAGARAYSL